MLKSVAGIDQIHAPGTLVVNARFSRNCLTDPVSREKLKALFLTYFAMGGMQLQVNVVDQETLQKAFKNPGLYADLIIRVGGYSEYWSRLSPERRQTVLERTEHGL